MEGLFSIPPVMELVGIPPRPPWKYLPGTEGHAWIVLTVTGRDFLGSGRARCPTDAASFGMNSWIGPGRVEFPSIFKEIRGILLFLEGTLVALGHSREDQEHPRKVNNPTRSNTKG